MTRAKAIKKHCFDCAGESYKEVVLCELPLCPLWPFRLGNSPASKAYRNTLARFNSVPTSSSKTSGFGDK